MNEGPSGAGSAQPLRADALFACAPEHLELSDCSFYHIMELPGFGLTSGSWDLRNGVGIARSEVHAFLRLVLLVVRS